MADPRYPVVMIGGVPVVDAPQEIDAANAECFRKMLLHAACRGHAVVVNMTATRFFDSSAVHVLTQAHERAVAAGDQLLLVIPADAAVLRILALTGLDQLIPRFADLNEALSRHTPSFPGPCNGMPRRPQMLAYRMFNSSGSYRGRCQRDWHPGQPLWCRTSRQSPEWSK
jgi:anti-anti-sigma factor